MQGGRGEDVVSDSDNHLATLLYIGAMLARDNIAAKEREDELRREQQEMQDQYERRLRDMGEQLRACAGERDTARKDLAANLDAHAGKMAEIRQLQNRLDVTNHDNRVLENGLDNERATCARLQREIRKLKRKKR